MIDIVNVSSGKEVASLEELMDTQSSSSYISMASILASSVDNWRTLSYGTGASFCIVLK